MASEALPIELNAQVQLLETALDEADDLVRACERHELGYVSLIAPTTTPERAAEIAASTSGFLYLTGIQGITGSTSDASSPKELVRRFAP